MLFRSVGVFRGPPVYHSNRVSFREEGREGERRIGPDVYDFVLVEGLVHHGFFCELSMEFGNISHECDPATCQYSNYRIKRPLPNQSLRGQMREGKGKDRLRSISPNSSKCLSIVSPVFLFSLILPT